MVDRRQFLGVLLASAVLSEARADHTAISLPSPQLDDGVALMQALKVRQSSRAFSAQPLPVQVLANLLWACAGINRPDSGKRTAPSAHNWQEIDVYVALKTGTYRYDARAHALMLVVDTDLRGETGQQTFVATAPVNLVFVANLSRMGGASDRERAFYAAADCGFIAQNAYLYCASAGLATVVRGWVDGERLGKALRLEPDQRVILAQTVGYPA